MRILAFLCAFVTAAIANSLPKLPVFKKCCPQNYGLFKITDPEVHYECVDKIDAADLYNITDFAPLILSESVKVSYQIPDDCELSSAPITQVNIRQSSHLCYDRLVSEIINGSIVNDVPQTVAIGCNDVDQTAETKMKIDRFRKCCPNGQVYDREYHSCRDSDMESTGEWLLKQLNANGNYVYEVEHGLLCKSEEYAVELSEEMFVIEVTGSYLYITEENGKSRLTQDEWCIDRDYNNTGLVARVCTQDCLKYGAFCFRKCCPVGEHFQTIRKGTVRSTCVPNNDDSTVFDMSPYLEPLEDNYIGLTDVQGIREGLTCEAGKFFLNRSQPSDYHWLRPDGTLLGPSVNPREYCIETFDLINFFGNNETEFFISLLSCYQEKNDKNFLLSAIVITISAVCLAVTLVIYCALPELRNLHGRTVICHVSTMLVAFTCLARAQFEFVSDIRLCTVIGYTMYFGFVAAFFWLNVMCFDIWWTFGSIRTVQPLRKGAERRRFAWYSLYAWSMTILLTLTMFMLDTHPIAKVLDANMGMAQCWFGSKQNSDQDWPHYIFFVIPLGVLTCVNFVLWMLTARHCARVRSEVHRLQAGSVGERAKKRFRIDRAKYILTGKLWVVMGAGWFTELLSTLTQEPPWLWAVIDLINELQGVFIFIILVIKPKVYYLIRKKLGLEKPDAQKNGPSSSGRTSSTFLSRTISTDERTNLRTSLPNTNGLKKA